ncbi:ferredoxin [Streptomyces cyaneofuscatus]|uniref:ferredoxin n=1 Tax=Streptomyces TaxID=1883 RepID=UPI002E145979|nr:ferredoxin [Streptomyces cyaneofuscatus]WTF33361.1 ferredoxin [Streptomyces cyaneofuscatus]
MATVRVDRKECVGSGLCAAMHPQLFRLDAEGLGEAVQGDLMDADAVEFAQDVADCCPGGAVEVSSG